MRLPHLFSPLRQSTRRRRPRRSPHRRARSRLLRPLHRQSRRPRHRQLQQSRRASSLACSARCHRHRPKSLLPPFRQRQESLLVRAHHSSNRHRSRPLCRLSRRLSRRLSPHQSLRRPHHRRPMRLPHRAFPAHSRLRPHQRLRFPHRFRRRHRSDFRHRFRALRCRHLSPIGRPFRRRSRRFLSLLPRRRSLHPRQRRVRRPRLPRE